MCSHHLFSIRFSEFLLIFMWSSTQVLMGFASVFTIVANGRDAENSDAIAAADVQ